MTYKLPLVPGYWPSFKDNKERYGIGSKLYVLNKMPIVTPIDEKKENNFVSPDMVQVMLTSGRDVSNKPSWLVFDKEILTFDAYFKVTVNESIFNYSIRFCKILYFLEDNTIKVMEPPVINNGASQGCLIKRHKIPRSSKQTNKFYELIDLNVGKTIEFYGKVFKIIGVDSYTRDILYKMGVDVPKNLPMPKDPYLEYRKENSVDQKHVKINGGTLKRYKDINLTGKVLSFKAYWDDRNTLEGDLHFMELRYFLLDDTIALIEIYEDGNSKTFLQRQRIPKNGKFLKPIGYDEEKQLLKVMGKSIDTKYQWYALDSQHAGYSVENTYYNASDLYIGAQLFIYNRLIILTECDEFTKNYYKNVYGLKSFASVVPPKTKRQKLEEELNKIRNATLIKSRDQNVLKRLRSEADNHVFIFKAKMVSNDPINLSRHFLLKYFFNSNTFGIYEITEPNSGVIGGEFRSKRSISIFDENEKSFIYSEIAVGSKLFIDDFQFVLTDVDDKTLKFMMAHPKEFYHSNVEMLNNQLYDLINTEGSNINKFYDKCFQNRPLVPREIFRQVLHDEFKNELSQHAIAVFALIYKKVERFKEVADEMFQRVVQNELRRAFFRNFDCLDIAMKQRNIHQINGVLDHDETLKILKTNRVPLLPEIQNRLLTKFTDLENGKVKFKDMIDFMDYLKNPTETPKGVAREILMAKPETVYIQVGKLVEFMQSFKPTYEQ